MLIASILASSNLAWLVPSTTAAGHLLGWVAFGTVILGYLMSSGHDLGALCEECITRLPLDVTAKAQRRRPQLRYTHLVRGSLKRSYLTWALMLGMALLPGFFFPKDSTAQLLLQSLFGAWLAVHMWSTDVHRRLQPWCPWCRGGGGGERASSPDPAAPQMA